MRRWALLLLVAGCTEAEPAYVVAAASSLTDVMQALEPEFERRLQADVELAFAGSQALRLQIEQGAPVDVFLSADERHVDALVPSLKRRFATNALTVVVPEASSMEAFDDLGAASRVVVGGPDVPVGRYTAEVLERVAGRDKKLAAHIRGAVVSRESNARLVLAKVELGEADAAIVYATDAAGRRVKSIPIPSDLNVTAEYFAAVVRDSESARAIVEVLTGPAGRAALEAHGFDAR